MKMKSFFLFFLCLFLVAACSDKEVEPGFAIENSGDIVVNWEGGSTMVFSFTSAREWKASCSADWLSVSPLSGESGKASLTVTAKSANSTAVDRSATIVLSSGTVQKEITLTQEAGDYKIDKSVRTLQTASEGNGIPIIIMGDGFTQQEINDGLYADVMDKACENIFTEEPVKSLRDYFDVYAVTAVSKSKDFTSGNNTVFSCKLEGGGSTAIEGNDKVIQTYARYVRNVNLNDVLVIVILNTRVHAGTTYMYFNDENHEGLDFAIAYCPTIKGLESEDFRQVLTHEAVGHGFAKLDDEYAYDRMGTIPVDKIAEVKLFQAQGWMQNVDFTSDPSKVLWSEFIRDSRYGSEGLGVFEGACTYIKGAYRPSVESMMNSNKTPFNAPCRKEIYDRVIKRGKGYTPAYEEFVAFDMLHKPQQIRGFRARAVEEKPFARPRLVRKALSF